MHGAAGIGLLEIDVFVKFAGAVLVVLAVTVSIK